MELEEWNDRSYGTETCCQEKRVGVRIDIKNMDSATYEDNAISSLLEIKKLKTEVAELEFCLQLK